MHSLSEYRSTTGQPKAGFEPGAQAGQQGRGGRDQGFGSGLQAEIEQHLEGDRVGACVDLGIQVVEETRAVGRVAPIVGVQVELEVAGVIPLRCG